MKCHTDVSSHGSHQLPFCTCMRAWIDCLCSRHPLQDHVAISTAQTGNKIVSQQLQEGLRSDLDDLDAPCVLKRWVEHQRRSRVPGRGSHALLVPKPCLLASGEADRKSVRGSTCSSMADFRARLQDVYSFFS